MTTYSETAAKRKQEGSAAAHRGDFAEAARCFLWSAEAYQAAGNEIGAAEMREVSGVYQRLRDKQQGELVRWSEYGTVQEGLRLPDGQIIDQYRVE